MKLDIASLKGVPGKQLQDTVALAISHINVQDDELKLLEPVYVDFVADNKGNVILISGQIKTSIELICGRCLTKVAFPIAISFEEFFYSESQAKQITDQALLEEGHIFSGNEISLAEMVEQNIIFNLPLRVVCQEKCQGFCPNCGGDLNLEKCDCVNEEVDPRLAVLEKLLKPSSSIKGVEK